MRWRRGRAELAAKHESQRMGTLCFAGRRAALAAVRCFCCAAASRFFRCSSSFLHLANQMTAADVTISRGCCGAVCCTLTAA